MHECCMHQQKNLMFESVKRRSRESTLFSTSKTRAYEPAYQGRLSGLQYAAIRCNTLQHAATRSFHNWISRSQETLHFCRELVRDSHLIRFSIWKELYPIIATLCNTPRHYTLPLQQLHLNAHAVTVQLAQSCFVTIILFACQLRKYLVLLQIRPILCQSSPLWNQTSHSFDRINTIVKNKNLYIYKYDVSTGKWASSCDEINRALSWVKGALCPITLAAHLTEFNALLVW